MCHDPAPDPPATPPPTRGELATEQRLTASAALDTLATADVLRVINDQDATIAGVVRQAIPQLARLVDAVARALRDGGRLIYLGAGTSGRLGVLDASECPPTFHSDPEQVVGVIAGGDAALRRAGEAAEDDEPAGAAAIADLDVSRRDVVLGIAAGGTTPYVWGALAEAAHRGATTAMLTCVPLGRIARLRDRPTPAPDHLIELPVGPEVITGSTRLKAGTATKLALNMITTTAFVALGKTWGNLMIDLRASNAKLRDRALRILTSQTDLPPDQARDCLDRAGGRVKLALVMARLDVDAAEAQRRLEAADGRLRAILGPPR